MNKQHELIGFQRYLMAKKSVDDRALNKDVFQHLSQSLAAPGHLRVLEVGAGIGTMIQRLFETVPFFDVDYTLMDVALDNLAAVLPVLSDYANQNHIHMQILEKDHFVLSADGKQCRIHLLEGDLMELPDFDIPRWDGIIAHAVLDLLPLDAALPVLFASLKAGGWLYSTINFDGMTLLEPEIDRSLDHQIINAYHDSMDNRRLDGFASAGSLTGRKLFYALQKQQFKIQAAGASDWFVFANEEGIYPFDEAFFLECILDFFEESVGNSKLVGSTQFQRWLELRRKQVKTGALMLVTHQYDYFAVRTKETGI